MLRSMCGVSLKKGGQSDDLRKRLGVESVADIVRRSRLRWFGHLERKEENDWVSACRNISIDGKCTKGRGKKTWMEVIKDDLRKSGLNRQDAKDRDLWRSRITGTRPTCTSADKHLKCEGR